MVGLVVVGDVISGAVCGGDVGDVYVVDVLSRSLLSEVDG
jgi:hypothetical protein